MAIGQARKLIPIGTRFGKLVVVDNNVSRMPTDSEYTNGYRRIYGAICICDCDESKSVQVDNYKLKGGKQTSCGCGQLPGENNNAYKHGDYGTYLYGAWKSLKSRETISNLWADDYITFKKDVLAEIGERPANQYRLTRRNLDYPFQGGNMRWGTHGQIIKAALDHKKGE